MDTHDKRIAETVERLSELVSADLNVMEWREMNEVMVSQMDADDKGGQIMLGILYLVIAFGIFGTVLMLTAERKREFGVLVAIGMQKKKLASIMTLEMVLIGILGLLGGVLISSIIILYGVDHPVFFRGEMALMFEEYGMEPKLAFMTIDSYYISQIVIVLTMVLLAIGYPLRKIFGMNVVNALRA
jgi:ABC-type lipoprotein release transport system permease subunit